MRRERHLLLILRVYQELHPVYGRVYRYLISFLHLF